MKRIAKEDWDRVQGLACEIANASGENDLVISDSRTEELMRVLNELEAKYGACSKITATIADYAEEERRLPLYRAALRQAKAEGDIENERMILESLSEFSS